VSFYVSLMNIIIKNIFIINISIGIILLINNIKSIYNKKSSNYILTSCYIFIYLLIILNRTINNYDVQFWTTWILILNIYTISLKQDLFSRIFSKKILVIFLILFLISNFIDYRYYYRVFKNEWTQGVLVGPNTPLKYFNSAVQVELKNDFEQNCIDSNENEIILYDDITYIALQGYSKKVSPLTYTEYPFYQNQTLEIGKERFSKFIENYKKPVIYAACAYNGSLPDKFKITHTNRKYKICCYKYKIQ